MASSAQCRSSMTRIVGARVRSSPHERRRDLVRSGAALDQLLELTARDLSEVEQRPERTRREQSVASAPQDPRRPAVLLTKPAQQAPSCRPPPRPPPAPTAPRELREDGGQGLIERRKMTRALKQLAPPQPGELTANARMGARHDPSAPVPMMHTVSGTCKLCCLRTRWAWCQAAFCHVLRCRAQPHPFGAAPLDPPHRLVSLEPEFALKLPRSPRARGVRWFVHVSPER